MKKIVKYITLLAVTLLATSACDYDDTNFANLTTELDPNATFYVQFKDASKSLKTDVNPDTGALIDISTIVTVGLMGAPQAQDISVNLTVDPSTTLTSNQYTLSSTSVIIPAGQTYGSVDFTAYAAEMEIEKPETLVMTMDAGANTAGTGLELKYDLVRPCAQDAEKIKGDWTITMQDSYGDGWNGASITVKYGSSEMDIDLDSFTTDGGVNGEATVTIPAGTGSVKFFFNSGDWDSEVTFQITAPNGVEVGSGGPSPAVGEINIDACLL